MDPIEYLRNGIVDKLLKKYEHIPEIYRKLFLEGYKQASKSEDKKDAIDRYLRNGWAYGTSGSDKEKPVDEDEVIYE